VQYLVSGFNGFVGQSLLTYINEQKGSGIDFTFLTSNERTDSLKNIHKIKLRSIDEFFNIELKHGSFSTYIHAMSSPRCRGTLRFSDNMMGLRKALNACKELKIGKFVYLSSGAVYEDSSEKKREVDRLKKLCGLENDYVKSKLISERWVKKYCLNNGIEYCILRLFTFGGKSLVTRLEFALSEFVRSACINKLITVQNPKLQRSYLHQSDLAKSIVSASNIKKWNNTVVNVGSSEEISMADLANKVAFATGAEIHIDQLINCDSNLNNLYVPQETEDFVNLIHCSSSIETIVAEMVAQY
jgi:nucleoside-diphosphate-sugar epimerase